jgi:TetR/AcrR family transcriptional regulator, fatty acid biosynthesis regulator
MQTAVGEQPPAAEKATDAPGKTLLLEAALRLTSTSRSLSNLGLRELAREAGLNPNTFYRHFKDVDDLGLTVIRQISTQLRQPLRDLRREAAERAVQSAQEDAPKLFGIDLQRGRRVCHETVQLFFDFVAQHPEAFIIGVRELHGASAVLRAALQEVMDEFAADMAEDIVAFKLLPDIVNPGVVLQVSNLISRNLFQLSLDYIGQPESREAICALAEEQIVMLFTGASVLQGLGQLRLQEA